MYSRPKREVNMKLFSKRRKLNNKGLSLVELVCAVAIFGIATTAIGGAMVVSAQNYSRGTYELDVQQEAQTTTNLIGNLLVDAATATFDDSNPDFPLLTINGDGVTYNITFDKNAGKLTYEETGSADDGVLAENVTGFSVDLSDFTTNKSAEVALTIGKNNKAYTATYSTTSRNASVDNVGATKAANIQIEKKVILEPGERYVFPITVSGMSVTEAGGIGNTSLTGTAGSSTLNVTNTQAEVYIGDDAYDTLSFTVFTNGIDANTGDKYDTETVYIFVRRITSVSATRTLVSGELYKAGSVYRVDAAAAGTNLSKELATGYDSDYINPKYLDFNIYMTGLPVGALQDHYVEKVAEYEDVDSPYILFRLKQDMPLGSKITTIVSSKHADGMVTGETKYYNKASKDSSSDDPYANIYVENIFERFMNGPWNPSPINRGNNNTWFYWNDLVTLPSANLGNGYLDSIKIWDVNDTEPMNDDAWISIGTTGSEADLKLEKRFTLLFEPDKEYYVKMKLEVYKDTNYKDGEKIWPEPTTSEFEYVTQGKIGKAGVKFSCPSEGINDYVDAINDEDNPLPIAAGTAVYLEGVALDVDELKDEMVYTVQKKVDTPEGWENVYNINIEKQVGWFKINAGDAGETYRILVGVNFPWYKYDYATKTFSTDSNYYPLYNITPTSEVGVVYFKYK